MAKLQRTTDLWLSSFLIQKGHAVKDIEINGSRGAWLFDLNDEEWKKMKLEFLGSEVSKIKQIQESLKDLVH